MRFLPATILLGALALGCVREAEGPPEAPLLPGGYRVRLDGGRPDPGSFVTAETPEGLRVTTGPGGIAWRPQDTVRAGEFRVEAAFTIFGAPVAYREGYGIFVGGHNLDGPSPRYLYLLVRPSGDFTVKRRVGQATETIVDWLPHSSIVPVSADGDTPLNVLAVESTRGEVRFFINGTVVFRSSAAEIQPWGVAGLRVNHRLDLLVRKWSLAPPGGRTTSSRP